MAVTKGARVEVADPKKNVRKNVRLKAPVPIWRRLMLTSVLLMLVIATPGTVLVLFFGMLPTIVAFVVDPSRGKYAASTVGGMNFAAIFPFLVSLWLGGNSISAAGAVLTDAVVMTAIYMAAAFGWILHQGLPPIAAVIQRITGTSKVALLRMRQQQLIDAWGEEVAQPSLGSDVPSA